MVVDKGVRLDIEKKVNGLEKAILKLKDCAPLPTGIKDEIQRYIPYIRTKLDSTGSWFDALSDCYSASHKGIEYINKEILSRSDLSDKDKKTVQKVVGSFTMLYIEIKKYLPKS